MLRDCRHFRLVTNSHKAVSNISKASTIELRDHSCPSRIRTRMCESECEVWAALNTPADEGEGCGHGGGVGCTCWPIHHSSEAAPAPSSLLIDSQDIGHFRIHDMYEGFVACFLDKNSLSVPPSRYKFLVAG
jgi:hypothetical protein